MKFNKLPMPCRLLFSVGILLATGPVLLHDYLFIPDFFRGFLTGLGLTFEIIGLIKLRQMNKMNNGCYTTSATTNVLPPTKTRS